MLPNLSSTPKKEELNESSTQKQFDCIMIHESNEIIVIDDDDDNETENENVSKNSIEEISSINKIYNSISSESSKSNNDELNIKNSTNSLYTSVSNNDEENEKNTGIPILNKNIEKNVENNNEANSHIDHNVSNANELSDETKLYDTIASEESFHTLSTTHLEKNIENNDDTVIYLDNDSTINEIPSNITNNRPSTVTSDDTDIDDSIIFVSESIDLDKFKPSTSKALDYIPLDYKPSSPPPKKQKSDGINIQNYKNSLTPLVIRKGSDLFTAKEYKKICNYNTNTYNPHKESNEEPKNGKRMVLIDGSNVAFHHALSKTFSVKGLEICLEYFEKMGHDVKAIVPQFRLQSNKSTDPKKLENLYHSGKIVFTPCKTLPGKCATSYDDRFLLQLATELDAAIISNDNYRDLIIENPAFKKIIENRVIGYTWCNDMFLLPKDPYGRLGPTLTTILNRT